MHLPPPFHVLLASGCCVPSKSVGKTPANPPPNPRPPRTLHIKTSTPMQGVTRVLMVSTFRENEIDGIYEAMVPDTNHGGRSRIATRGGRIGDQQSTLGLIPVHGDGDASKCNRSSPLNPTFIPCLDSTTRTNTLTQGLCGSTEQGI